MERFGARSIKRTSRELGPAESSPDGVSPEALGRHILERTAKLAEWSARARYYHGCHEASLRRLARG